MMNKQPHKHAANSVRCPWCQRQPVRLKRGRLVSHLTPGGVRCVGVGQPMKATS